MNGTAQSLRRLARKLGFVVPPPVSRVSTRQRLAALTFDDGPDPAITPQVLDLLARHQAKATFFLLGESAVRHPRLVRRIAEEGHVIGSHAWTHVSLPAVPALRRMIDIFRTRRILAPHGGNLFRPPYGALDQRMRTELFLLRYKVVLWSASAEDWERRSARQMLEKLREGLKPGAIFLLHDHLAGPRLEGAADRTTILAALSDFLTEATPDYGFVTVPALLGTGETESVTNPKASH